MKTELLIQYVTYGLATIGVLAFLVSSITQAIKELPYLNQIQTNAVAMVVSLVICPATVIIACQCFRIMITWYYIFASFVGAFIVYLVSTGGWEKISEMWNRTKYKR